MLESGAVIFVLGTLWSLSPCAFPLLGPFVAHSAKTKGNPRRAIIAGLVITSGIMLSITLYGSLAWLLASPLARHGTVLRQVFGAAIMFLGVVALTPLKNMFARLRPPQRLFSLYGLPAVFMLGFGYSLIAAPCSAPVFLSALMLASATGDLALTLTGCFLFAAGASIPFIALSLLVVSSRGYLSARFGDFTRSIEVFSALLLVGSGLALALGII